MLQNWAMDLAKDSMLVIFKLTGPILLFGLAVGIVISVFQAATQIQEASLSFIPKVVTVFLTILFLGSWMLRVLTDFSGNIFGNLHNLVR